MGLFNLLGFPAAHLTRCSEWSLIMQCPLCDYRAESADLLAVARSCAYHSATAHPEDEELTQGGKRVLAAVLAMQKEERQ
jgi:hypothetical protein